MNATTTSPWKPVLPNAAIERPVNLQLRPLGGVVWWHAVKFDAGNERHQDAVESAVELLGQVDPTLHARIVSPGLGVLGVLKSYHVATGWLIGE